VRRVTHTLLGAAVSMPIALSLDPELAIGTVWWGMTGGGFPDWVDLRSELRRPLRLRHRGVSHSVFAAILSTCAVWWALTILRATEFSVVGLTLSPSRDMVWLWSTSFGLGFLSHLAGDACTHAGIRPLLPVSDRRFWLIPRPMRSRSDGFVDRIGRFLALTAVLGGLALYAARLFTPIP
jgi:membrane-bound metal-dependent hydrolase YbcI (DUF457 family)